MTTTATSPISGAQAGILRSLLPGRRWVTTDSNVRFLRSMGLIEWGAHTASGSLVWITKPGKRVLFDYICPPTDATPSDAQSVRPDGGEA